MTFAPAFPFPLTEANLRQAMTDRRYYDGTHPGAQSWRAMVSRGWATLYPDETLRGDHTDDLPRHLGPDGHVYASDGSRVADGRGGGLVHVRSYTRTINGHPVQVSEHDRGGGAAAKAPFDVDKAVEKLRGQAKAKSEGYCATSVKAALEAGGLTVGKGIRSAKDMGPALEKAGFEPMDEAGYIPRKGDVVVIQPYPGGRQDGHIAMYDGRQWISDFKQRDMWGGHGYRTQQPPHQVYRRR